MFALRASGASRGTMLRKSVASNVVVSSILPVRKPAPRVGEGAKADGQFFQKREKLRSRVAPEQREFALHRGDGLDGMGAADGLGARFGQAEMQDLAFGDHVADAAGDSLDWHGGIDAVLVEKVDPVGLEALQHALDRGADMGGLAVGAGLARAGDGVDVEAEFGRDHHPVADRGAAPLPPAIRWRRGHTPRRCRSG